MFLDFEHLDVKQWRVEFGEDCYCSKVLDFLEQYIFRDSFTSHTSGSTGTPKEIVFEKKRADVSALLSNEFFGINSDTKILLCLDIRFIGSKMLLVRAMMAKAKVWVVKPTLNFYKELDTYKFDFISLTPLHVYHLAENCPNFFQNISTCLIGASVVTNHLEKKIKDLNVNTHFFESFAMTETVSHFALRNITMGDKYFQVLNGFEISKSENNCLVVYHPIILPNKITTNDVVDVIDRNKFIFLGRRDNVINSGGLKIHPEVLEKEWSSFLPFQFVLVGEEDSILGQKIVMVVDSCNSYSFTEIQTFLQKKDIPKRFHPKVIYRSNDEALANSSKINRKEIILNTTLLA